MPPEIIDDSDIEEDVNVNQEEVIFQQIQSNVQRRELVEFMNQVQNEDQIKVIGVSKHCINKSVE